MGPQKPKMCLVVNVFVNVVLSISFKKYSFEDTLDKTRHIHLTKIKVRFVEHLIFNKFACVLKKYMGDELNIKF